MIETLQVPETAKPTVRIEGLLLERRARIGSYADSGITVIPLSFSDELALIFKPPRPGQRGSLELAGRTASKLVSKLFSDVGRDDPGELEELVLKRSVGKWTRSESKVGRV